MVLPKPLVRAWFQWQRTPLPVEAARMRRVGDPLHQVESDLDHFRSYVSGLGLALFGERREWDYVERAADELEVLHRISIELDSVAAPEQAKLPYRAFIEASTVLLREVARLKVEDGAA